MLDAKLVAAAIASRKAYEKVAAHIADTDLSPQAGFWWKLIGAWYTNDPLASRVDADSLRSLGDSRIANPKHRETILGFLRDIGPSDSPTNVVQVALELKRHNVGMELAAAIASRDDKKARKLLPILANLQEATSLGVSRQSTKFEEAAGIEDLFDKVGDTNRIPIAPKILNQRLGGGALPGHHLVLYGRPEMGKSTMSINMAVKLAKRNQRVLYVGNEDQINILKARAVSCALGLTPTEIEADRGLAIAGYRDRGFEQNLRFVQMSNGGPEDIRAIIEKVEPTVLLIDQIRNLTGEGDGLTHRMEENGIAVRQLLLEYGMIGISVAQAGASAEGKPWLGMGDLDSSKTGLPATADALIGIGANTAMMQRDQRALSLPKNKLSSAHDAHEGVMVEIDKSRSTLK